MTTNVYHDKHYQIKLFVLFLPLMLAFCLDTIETEGEGKLVVDSAAIPMRTTTKESFVSDPCMEGEKEVEEKWNLVTNSVDEYLRELRQPQQQQKQANGSTATLLNRHRLVQDDDRHSSDNLRGEVDDNNDSNGGGGEITNEYMLKMRYAPAETLVENRYIVVFDDGLVNDEIEINNIVGLALEGIFGVERGGAMLSHALMAERLIVHNDFDNNISLGTLKGRRANREKKLASLLLHSSVKFIEEEQIVSLMADQHYPPSWGLDRVDQPGIANGLDKNYHYDYTGKGVTVYIVDTGIRASHNDFDGRVVCGFNAFEDSEDCDDYNGHGTHVAAIVGGSTYGVAKEVDLVTVKVIDSSGSGTTWTILRGMNYISQRSIAQGQPLVVANLSLGSFLSPAVNLAAVATTLRGVFVTAAAGNAGQPACLISPASTDFVMTVSATNRYDVRSDFSNWGDCVDIFAPGEDILSAWYTSDDATKTISGTSMASPHLAGAAALYIEIDPSATVTEIKQRILDDALVAAVKDPNGSPNVLLYTGGIFLNDPQPPASSSRCSYSFTFVGAVQVFGVFLTTLTLGYTS